MHLKDPQTLLLYILVPGNLGITKQLLVPINMDRMLVHRAGWTVKDWRVLQLVNLILAVSPFIKSLAERHSIN